MKKILRICSVASCLLLVSTVLLRAQILDENFNNFENDQIFPVSGSGWASIGRIPDELISATSSEGESPFTATPNGLGLLETDSSTTAGIGFGIKKTIATQTDIFTASFDFAVIPSGANNMSPAFAIYSGDIQAFTIGFWSGGNPGGTSGKITGGGETLLADAAIDTWYHAELKINVAAQTVSVVLTPFRGGAISFDNIPFRNKVSYIDTVVVFNNTKDVATGSYVVDNLVVADSAP